MRIRVRAAAAVLVVLLLAGVTAAVVHSDQPSQATRVRTADSPPTTEPEPEAEPAAAAPDDAAPTTAVAAASTPVTSAKPAKPKPAPPAPAPAPKPKAPAGPKVRSGDFGPRPPGSPSFPYDPNRTSWTATSNGITLKLTIDRQGAAVGQPVTFTLEATHGTEACCGLYLLFGDGAKFDQQAAEPCGGSKGSPGTKTATTTHPYNGDGLWEFSFQAYTGNCNTDYHSYGSFYGWVNITPGAPTANGPAVPKMEGGWGGRPSGHESDQMWVTVAGHGMDEDGYVHHFSVDWGDGSPLDTSPGDPMGCRPTSGGWPATSHAWMPPNGSPSPPPTHQYAAPGDYAITVTVHSIGCNGTDEQLGLLKMTWHTNGYNP